MTVPALRLGAGLAALCTAVALAGCAVVRPPSTVPPTGWPDPPSGPARTPTARPAPSASASAAPRTVTRDGIVLPLPEGYLDATGLVTDVPTAGPTRLVAYLRNPAQHGITVQTWAASQQTLAGFLDFYVAALDADPTTTVTGRRAVTMGGLPGTELTLRGSDGSLSTVFVTMRAPKSVVMVLAPVPDEGRRRAVEQVATGLRFG
nr:hypothetical protein [Propionibacterium sp.]